MIVFEGACTRTSSVEGGRLDNLPEKPKLRPSRFGRRRVDPSFQGSRALWGRSGKVLTCGDHGISCSDDLGHTAGQVDDLPDPSSDVVQRHRVASAPRQVGKAFRDVSEGSRYVAMGGPRRGWIAIGLVPVRDLLADHSTFPLRDLDCNAGPMPIAGSVALDSASPSPGSRFVIGVVAEKRQEVGGILFDAGAARVSMGQKAPGWHLAILPQLSYGREQATC